MRSAGSGAPQLRRDPVDGMPNVPLSPETRRRLDALFPEPAREQAARLLITHGGDNLPFAEGSDGHRRERIRFAALKVSNGEMAELESVVEMAQIDSRDVLMAAGSGHDVLAHQSWFPERHAG